MSTEMCKVFWFLSIACLCLVSSLPEPGVWEDVKFTQVDEYKSFSKSVYKGTNISVKIDCSSADPNAQLKVGWLLRYSPCAGEYGGLNSNPRRHRILEMYYKDPGLLLFYPELNYSRVEYMRDEEIISCNTGISLNEYTKKATIEDTKIPPNQDVPADDSKLEQSSKSLKKTTVAPTTKKSKSPKKTTTTSTTKKPSEKTTTTTPAARKRREADADGVNKEKNDTTENPAKSPITEKTGLQNDKIDHHNVATAWKDGYYIFILYVRPVTGVTEYDAKMTVRMVGEYGYISAVEWPLLIFYGVMGLVYIVFGLVWLVMLACNWRDLLRVQYWIGGVIVLGMLEKAVFYSEYQSITNYGVSVSGAVILAEVVSCLKRALARMLVIIVSLGFGIVKPRLGPTFHKVLFVGGLYFILASIEGCIRALKPKGDQSKDVMLSAIPLAVVDASICWWIFSSLIQTTRQLRLRRNIVKLSLYRHFTNTLIFAVLASIVFMVWSIIQIKMKQCITDWRELWIDEAFWHLLFSVILMVIMFLWRPSTNNQRYAFSPLLDAADDDEEDDTVLNDAFDGMKMRTKLQANGSPRHKEQNSIEDDLKWVEENIPSSVVDKALPSLLDSDEEVMTAKYEMSKMQ